MAKKTVKVIDLIRKTNEVLQNSTCDPEGRRGMMTLLESTLHQTGNYQGFRYLQENEVPEGHKSGVYYVDGKPNFDNTDNTRIKYFVNSLLIDIEN